MTTPAAYLRKSKDGATKGDHLAILMDAVKAHGHNGDTVVYDDWARSGDIRKLSKRTGWRELCKAIERGDHDVVFMNDLDRGGRSVEEWARFMRVARDRGVRVIAGGVDWSAPEKRTEFYLRGRSASCGSTDDPPLAPMASPRRDVRRGVEVDPSPAVDAMSPTPSWCTRLRQRRPMYSAHWSHFVNIVLGDAPSGRRIGHPRGRV